MVLMRIIYFVPCLLLPLIKFSFLTLHPQTRKIFLFILFFLLRAAALVSRHHLTSWHIAKSASYMMK